MAKLLSRDVRGAAAIEFGIIAPVLILMLVGLLQMGVMFNAQAGLKNAVAEGARYATIFPNPTDDQIRTRITDKRFGMDATLIGGPTITRGTGGPGGNIKFVDISMTYAVPLNFAFFTLPAVTLTETRRAYIL